MKTPSIGSIETSSKLDYMRWLEKMWEDERFGVPGRAEREERRIEAVLSLFEGLRNLARRNVEPPIPSAWGATRDGSLPIKAKHEQDGHQER
jgi:hypothetical protein